MKINGKLNDWKIRLILSFRQILVKQTVYVKKITKLICFEGLTDFLDIKIIDLYEMNCTN